MATVTTTAPPATVTSLAVTETTPVAMNTTLTGNNTTSLTTTINNTTPNMMITAGSNNNTTTSGVINTTTISNTTLPPDITATANATTTLTTAGSNNTTTIVSTDTTTYLSTEITTSMTSTNAGTTTMLSTTPGVIDPNTSLSSTSSTTLPTTTTNANNMTMPLTNSPVAGATAGNWFLDDRFDLISFWFGALAFVTLALVVLAIAMILQRCKKRNAGPSSPTDSEKDSDKPKRKSELEKDLEELRQKKMNGNDWIVMENENGDVGGEVGASEVSGGDDEDSQKEGVSEKKIFTEGEEPKVSAGSLGIPLSSYETKEDLSVKKEEYQTSSLVEDNPDGLHAEINGHPEFDMLEMIAEENDEKIAENLKVPESNVASQPTTTQDENTEVSNEKAKAEPSIREENIEGSNEKAEMKKQEPSEEKNIEIISDTEKVIVLKGNNSAEDRVEEKSEEMKEVAKPEDEKTKEKTSQIALYEKDHVIKFEKDNSCSSGSSSSSSTSNDEEKVSEETTKKKILTKKFPKEETKKLEEEKLASEQKRMNYERFQEKIRGLVKKYEGDDDPEGSNNAEDKIKKEETAENMADKKVIVEKVLKKQITENQN